ncbi:MAG: HEAT repeat domain-containing protein [bacterium]
MRTRSTFLTAALGAIAPLMTAHAQATLASRVAQVRDGVVHMQFDGRPGVCGDGKTMVGYRQALFAREYTNFGRWTDRRCTPGPLRVSLTVAGGEVTQLQTQVGGVWPTTSARVADLGTVASREASAYLFSLVPRLESESRKERLLLPAVLAEDAVVIAPLLALARDGSRLESTRRQAVQWLGLLGDATVIPQLVAFAKEASDDESGDKPGKKGLASSAVAALSYLDDNAGIPALMQLARNAPLGTRRNAVFWLGQNGDPRGLRTLHTVIEDTKEDDRVRKHAIFSLGNSDEVPAAEREYLRSVYTRLESDQLKESVFQAMNSDEQAGGRWLVERARDSHESVKLRKSALFWAGQREGTSTADIVSLYRDMDDTALREHAIFVLSQRQDDASVDALMRIARADSDSRMRGKALFWLAQKHDPRVTKLISDIVLK